MMEKSSREKTATPRRSADVTCLSNEVKTTDNIFQPCQPSFLFTKPSNLPFLHPVH